MRKTVFAFYVLHVDKQLDSDGIFALVDPVNDSVSDLDSQAQSQEAGAELLDERPQLMSRTYKLIWRLQELKVGKQQKASCELSLDMESRLLAFGFRDHFEQHFALELVFDSNLTQAGEEEEQQLPHSNYQLGNWIYFHDENAIVALRDHFQLVASLRQNLFQPELHFFKLHLLDVCLHNV